MKDLIEHTKSFVAKEMAQLSGSQDFCPFMLMECTLGHIYAGLLMPGDDTGKDRIADQMMALCAVHRPDEVVFVSTAWMVVRNSKEEMDRSLPVRKQADRMEAVFVVHHRDSTDKADTYSAPVIRDNNTVTLGEWTYNAGVGVSGRFGGAIRHGIKFGENMPPEMVEVLEQVIEQDGPGEAVETMLRALNTMRAGASKN